MAAPARCIRTANHFDFGPALRYAFPMVGTAKAICVDGHIHIHPCYGTDLAFSCLIDNLMRMGQSSASLFSLPIGYLAILAESRSCHYFRDAVKEDRDKAASRYAVRAGPEPGSLLVLQEDKPDLCLIAGRQIVTAERIEILALTTDADIPDGLPAQTVLDTIRAEGGIPVLSWAPGKWFFGRGQLVGRLIDAAKPGTLLLGDTSLRPPLWSEPRRMRAGRIKGLAVIAGSDPLPFTGEERRMGTYGFCRQGDFDLSRPVTELRDILRGPAAGLILTGRRGGLLTTVRRLLAARRAKKA